MIKMYIELAEALVGDGALDRYTHEELINYVLDLLDENTNLRYELMNATDFLDMLGYKKEDIDTKIL